MTETEENQSKAKHVRKLEGGGKISSNLPCHPKTKSSAPFGCTAPSTSSPKPLGDHPQPELFGASRWEFGYEHRQDRWTDFHWHSQGLVWAAQKAELSDWFSISSPKRFGLGAGELKLSEVNKRSPLAFPRPGFPFGTGCVACTANEMVETMRVNHGAGLVPAPRLSVATTCHPGSLRPSPSVPQFPHDKVAPVPSP